MTEPLDIGESILEEAQRLTHGDRNADYGHPLDDYTRTAALVSAMLAHKLKEPITAAEMALAMCCVKLSRQVHRPKRDNLVDLAGYAWVADRCVEEAKRRAIKPDGHVGLQRLVDDVMGRSRPIEEPLAFGTAAEVIAYAKVNDLDR